MQFSSPSGGDQFISSAKKFKRWITSEVFVSFWRRSVHINCSKEQGIKKENCFRLLLAEISSYLLDFLFSQHTSLFSSPSGGDQFISDKAVWINTSWRKFSSPSGGDQFISDPANFVAKSRIT